MPAEGANGLVIVVTLYSMIKSSINWPIKIYSNVYLIFVQIFMIEMLQPL